MSLDSSYSLQNYIIKERKDNHSKDNSGNILSYPEEEKYNLINENKNKIISFYSKFKYLCCKYKIDNIRKNHIDIIIKKVKIKLFKGIHESLKYCLITNINRLPQNFISNIKIDYNQIYLDKTISEIYSEFGVLPSLKEVIEKKMVKKDKTEVFILLMNTRLVNIINIYLMSNLFIYDKKKLEKKSGLNDVILFNFVANNIRDYFQYGKSFANKTDDLSQKNNIIKYHNNINNNSDNNCNNKNNKDSANAFLSK